MSNVKPHMKPKSVLLVGAAGVAAYMLLVVGIYAWHVKSLPVASDASAWGQFGDYLGGLLNPLFALLNVALIAYIALLNLAILLDNNNL
jgi:hypothetical protein